MDWFDTSDKYHWLDLKNILFPSQPGERFWDTIVHSITNPQAPNLLLLAAPIMLLLMIGEMIYNARKNMNLYGKEDLIGSIGVGIGYLTVTSLTKGVTFYLVWLVYYYLAPFTLPVTWWSFIVGFIVYDFLRYWGHRIAHEQRFWWATHITHHSSNHFNLAVAFRLNWIDQIKLVFFLPVPLLGFDPIQFFLIHQITVLYQFWQHTELIPKLHPIIEYLFVTPAAHRVHHGKNEKYIDRNYGSTLLIWDRLFGTYQPPTEKPIYGIKGEVKKPTNPFYLVFQEWGEIWRDVKEAPNWKKRWEALFAPPGKYKRE